MLYAADGSIRVTVVDGSEFTGVYAADGSLNVFVSDPDTFAGLYAACGAFNVTVVTTPGAYAPNGSLAISEASSAVPGTTIVTVVSGTLGPDLDAFILYDDFSGTSAALNGRTPDKGSDWVASGAAASNMIAGDGRLTQDADTYPGTGAGYAFNDLGEVAQKLTATWDAASIIYVPTIALSTSTLNTDPFLHGEQGTTNFLIRLGDGAGNFWLPGWNLWADNYTLAGDTEYITELHYDGSKTAAMVLKNSEGTILGQQLAYDPTMADYVGNYAFWETFDTNLGYTKATAEATSDYSFPTIDAVLEDTASFVVNAFGGTVDATTDLVISGDTVFQGGSGAIGAITTGDTLYIAFDVLEATSGEGEIGIIPNGGTSPTLAQDGSANALPGIPAGTGQKTFTMTVTADNADASLVICNTGANGAFSIKIREDSLVVIKNPPTEFTA